MPDARPIPDLRFGEYDFSERNARAATEVEHVATQMVAAAGKGGAVIAGLLPLSGVSVISSAVVARALHTQSAGLRELSRTLIRIYRTPHVALKASKIETGTIPTAESLVEEISFFVHRTAADLASESSLGVTAPLMSILGSLLVTGQGEAIAATLPWRIAALISFYYQNGGNWVVSLAETYRRAQLLSGTLSGDCINRIDLDSIRSDPEVFRYQVEETEGYIRSLLAFRPALSPAHFARTLTANRYPTDVTEAALVNVFGEPQSPFPQDLPDGSRAGNENADVVQVLRELIASAEKLSDLRSEIREGTGRSAIIRQFRYAIDEPHLPRLLRKCGHSEAVVSSLLPALPDVDVQERERAAWLLTKLRELRARIDVALSNGDRTEGVEDHIEPPQGEKEFDILMHIVDSISLIKTSWLSDVRFMSREGFGNAAAEEAYRSAVRSIDDARLKLAAEFQPLINAYASSLPKDKISDKKITVRILNDEVRERGFAFKCPKTGAASVLFVDQGNHPTIGRFRFTHSENGKAVVSFSTPDLPELEIVSSVPSPPAKSGHAGKLVDGLGQRSQGEEGRK